MESSISFYHGYGNSRFSFKGSMDVAGHGRPAPSRPRQRQIDGGGSSTAEKTKVNHMWGPSWLPLMAHLHAESSGHFCYRERPNWASTQNRPVPIAAMLRHTQAGEIGASRVRQCQFD
jgi:hypothetical protein